MATANEMNIWELVSILWLWLLPRIPYCWQSTPCKWTGRRPVEENRENERFNVVCSRCRLNLIVGNSTLSFGRIRQKLYLSACCTCNKIFFPHLTNQIIVFWHSVYRCRCPCLNSLLPSYYGKCCVFRLQEAAGTWLNDNNHNSNNNNNYNNNWNWDNGLKNGDQGENWTVQGNYAIGNEF